MRGRFSYSTIHTKGTLIFRSKNKKVLCTTEDIFHVGFFETDFYFGGQGKGLTYTAASHQGLGDISMEKLRRLKNEAQVPKTEVSLVAGTKSKSVTYTPVLK